MTNSKPTGQRRRLFDQIRTLLITSIESGTDVTIIALWLGHEQPATTAQIYLHADMSQKQKALARVASPGTTPGRYRPPDPLLAFLEAL